MKASMILGGLATTALLAGYGDPLAVGAKGHIAAEFGPGGERRELRPSSEQVGTRSPDKTTDVRSTETESTEAKVQKHRRRQAEVIP